MCLSIWLAVDDPAELEFPDPVAFGPPLSKKPFFISAYNGSAFNTRQVVTSTSVIVHGGFPETNETFLVSFLFMPIVYIKLFFKC